MPLCGGRLEINMVEWGDTIKALMLFVLLVAALTMMRKIDWANLFTAAPETPYSPDTTYTPFDDKVQDKPPAVSQPSWLEKFESLYDRHWMPNNRQMAVSLYNRNWEEDFGFNMSNAWRSHNYMLNATQVNKIENVIRGGEAGAFKTDGGQLCLNRYRVVYYALRYVGQISYRYGAGNEAYVQLKTDGTIDVLRDAEGNAVTPNSLDCSAFVKWIYAYNGLCVGNSGVARESAGDICTAESAVSIASKPLMYPGDLLFVEKGGEITHVGIFVCYADSAHNEMYVVEERQIGIDDQHLIWGKGTSSTMTEERMKAVGYVCFNKVGVYSGSFTKVASPKCFGGEIFSSEHTGAADYYIMPSADQSLFKEPQYPQSYIDSDIDYIDETDSQEDDGDDNENQEGADDDESSASS